MKTVAILEPTLLALRMDYRLLRRLPVDPSTDGWISSRIVPSCCFSVTYPTPLTRPVVVALSPSVWKQLDIDKIAKPNPEDPLNDPALVEEIRQICSGNMVLAGSQPVSHCYAGHQFGSFAGQLGDGAAIQIAECGMAGGTRGEVQLKGAGPTPYSRGSDGRKVLRSSIREFLCSEAMHFLGIPSTRAAAIVTSESTVERDPLYNGHVKREKCTVVTRVAETFVRFGSLEIAKESEGGGRKGPSADHPAIVAQVLDATTSLYYGYVVEQCGKVGDRPSLNASLAIAVFKEIATRTARLVGLWQSYGFCHGVLNTDNMSIVGLTIDYGPFAFMPFYDTEFVCNLSDEDGRYSYGAQPAMVLWNVERLAEAFGRVHAEIVAELKSWLTEHFLKMAQGTEQQKFSQRLGVVDPNGEVVRAFQQTLQATSADMHKVCCLLTDTTPFTSSHFARDGEEKRAKLAEKAATIANTIATYYCATPQYKMADIRQRMAKRRNRIPPHQLPAIEQLLQAQPEVASAMFNGASPADVAQFLQQETMRWQSIQSFRAELAALDGLPQEDKIKRDCAAWEAFLTVYYTHLESAVSSAEHDLTRRTAMAACNPRFVLYPWVLSQAIQQAESENKFDLVQQLCDRVQTPFELDERDGTLWTLAADNVTTSACSCSS